MPLLNGARIGPYEILAPAGSGGMGEVYRSRDTRLDRTVVIKILPGYLSEKPDAKPVVNPPYAATGDGKRFLANELPLQSTSHLTVILNWDAELKK